MHQTLHNTHLHKQLRNSSDTLPTSPDDIRHQQTPKDTNNHHLMSATHLQTSILGVWGCRWVSFSICCNVVALNCPEINGGGSWEHINGVCVCLWGLDTCMDVYYMSVYCLGLVLWSKCSILEKLWKSKFRTLDTCETSKYQNRPI